MPGCSKRGPHYLVASDDSLLQTLIITGKGAGYRDEEKQEQAFQSFVLK
jgi:hypothetical protein